MEFVIVIGGKIYEISELIKSVAWSDRLNDGCSKLEFSFVDDGLNIQNGSDVYFRFNGRNIFYGYVFKHGRSSTGEVSVIAYDQLRYAKGKDYMYIKNYKLTDLVNKMCTHFNFRKGHIADTKYILKTQAFDGDTWLDMNYTGINETLMNMSKMYSLRDEFGEIALRDLEDMTLNLILGDESLCYEYSYEKSIDGDFYNQIVFLVEEESKESQFLVSKDEKSIKNYGLLQYFETVSNSNAAQAKAKADSLLKLYNRELETLTLECIGDARVRAGSSFYIYVSDLKLNNRVYVKSVTHDFVPIHKMSIEVAL